MTPATQNRILWRNLLRNPHMLLWVASVIGCAAFGLWLVVFLGAVGLASMFALGVYLNRRRAKIEAEIEKSSGWPGIGSR